MPETQTTEERIRADQPQDAGAPVPSEPQEGKDNASTEPTPPQIAFGDDHKAVMREVHRAVRELERLQALTAQRKEELAALEDRAERHRPRPISRQEEDLEDDEVVLHGTRVTKQFAEEWERLQRLAKTAASEAARLRDADLEMEREEQAQAIQSHLRSLVNDACKMGIPNASERALRRAQRYAWAEFEERWDDFASRLPEGYRVSDEDLTRLITESVRVVHDDLTEFGRLQLAANREAATRQPPALGGSPAEPATKALKDMTMAELEEYRQKHGLTGGVLQFE